MAEEPQEQERTQEATPHKLEEARERGHVPQSRELGSFLVFLGFAIGLYFSLRTLFERLVRIFRDYYDFDKYRIENLLQFQTLSQDLIRHILALLVPLFFTVLIFSVGASTLQFGFLFTTEKIMPQLERINPLRGFSRIFSRETLVEFLKTVLKVLIISGILFLLLRGEMDQLSELGILPIAQIFLYLVKVLAKVLLTMLIFLAVLGILDFAYQKWRYAENLKMSFSEMKEELRQREGDPHIRSRIRQIQRERLRKQMMKVVPKADVVVTNPTHVAVALQYQRGIMKAPKVIAKGAGVIAQKIKEIASQAGVPIVERKELARILYRHVEINQMIPENLYTVVAEVLAYVYRLKRKYKEWMQTSSTRALAT